MATTIRQLEMAPDVTLAIPGFSGPTDAVWQRLESYIAYRYSARIVTWIVEGPGEWSPPLAPWSIDDPSNISAWSHRAQDWELFTPDMSPLGGFYFRHSGPFRVTATVGINPPTLPPDAVTEAARRLACYMAANPGNPGVTSESITIADALTQATRRDANWLAMAIQNSGAADLLRPYRKVQ